ncbi:tail fiber assembly protein [Leminorella grimontii]|uniref:tail fiber assembly protein n=1 Tax=Leminorella grimontii TaxID=82981 RepID=UPI00321FB5D2
MYLFSRTMLAFYPISEKQLYLDAGTLPEDVIEVSTNVRNTYNKTPPEGMKLGANHEGYPEWIEKSYAEYMATANLLRTVKIGEANAFMSSKQWPGKAALGRLEKAELEQYNLWLDYLDALEAVDTSSASDIEWPILPVVSAS